MPAMRSPEISIKARETKHAENGIRLTTDFLKKPARKIPGNTASHESKHATVAYFNGTGVESVTIIPGPGYLGLTKLARFDAAAAAAADADGHSGTSHDLAIIGFAGHDASSARSAARSVMDSNRDVIEDVAIKLEENGTIYESDIKESVNHTRKEREADAVVLTIKAQDGSERKHRINIPKNSSIMIPGEWVDFGNANYASTDREEQVNHVASNDGVVVLDSYHRSGQRVLEEDLQESPIAA